MDGGFAAMEGVCSASHHWEELCRGAVQRSLAEHAADKQHTVYLQIIVLSNWFVETCDGPEYMLARAQVPTTKKTV